MKKYIDFSVKGILFALVFVMTSCLSDGDETVSLEFANVKKMIVGEWVLESNSGTPRVLTFTDDGYYTDSSDGGTKKHPWRLASDYSDGQPYYGGIYLDGVYYDIVSWGDGHWRLKDRNGKILDFSRDGGTNNNGDNNDPNPTYTPGKAIDLGLPSKTLWASCNVGASKPEEFGDYFAWGETETKKVFSWDNYKWCNGSKDNLTKYRDSYYEKVDNKFELDPEDDAAYVKWGNQWRMPSLEQIEELAYKCSWTWTILNGVGGCKVIGPNGNSIFLPAAGFYDGASPRSTDEGFYWSRSHSSITTKIVRSNAIILQFYPEDPDDTDWDNQPRCRGSLIRPVRIK